MKVLTTRNEFMSIRSFYSMNAVGFMHEFAENFENNYNAARPGLINRLYQEEKITFFLKEFKSFLEKIKIIAYTSLFIFIGSFFASIYCFTVSIPLGCFTLFLCFPFSYLYDSTTTRLENLQIHLREIENNRGQLLLNGIRGFFSNRILTSIY